MWNMPPQLYKTLQSASSELGAIPETPPCISPHNVAVVPRELFLSQVIHCFVYVVKSRISDLFYI